MKPTESFFLTLTFLVFLSYPRITIRLYYSSPVVHLYYHLRLQFL